MLPLVFSFLVTACVYASVGFGGGSTYNALLALAEVDYKLLPVIALLCNLIVVSGGTLRFARSGHVDIKKIFPWIVTSVPAAWLGGYVEISEFVFVGLLGVSLFICGVRLLWPEKKTEKKIWIHEHRLFAPVIGAGLGGLAGMVGIGGGIFLAPILHLLKWAEAKSIAATCSVFILVNSVAGLTGQMMKSTETFVSQNMLDYIWLFPAVFVGGQIGSYLGAEYFEPKTVKKLTGLLTLYVACRLLWRWTEMFFSI